MLHLARLQLWQHILSEELVIEFRLQTNRGNKSAEQLLTTANYIL